MAKTLGDGRSTPGYATIWILGVVLGSAIRLVLWVLPSSLVRRAMKRALP
jgi:hypothetical protein